MPSLSSTQASNVQPATAQTTTAAQNKRIKSVSDKSSPAKSAAQRADRQFAQMLTAAVRQETESSLFENATGSAAPAAPSPNPFQQLDFLNLPSSFNVPDFLARRQSGQTTGLQQAASQPQPIEAATAVPADSKSRSKTVNPVDRANSIQGTERAAAGHSPGALPLSAFPRPTNDNGRGIHWIPTTSQSPEVIDKYVQQAVEMGIKWVTFLNDGTDVEKNDYLVEQLTSHGIEPVMRIYTDGGARVEGDVQKLVRHYKGKGVDYFQLYNEPNLRLENQGKAPDPEGYAAKWLSAAREVIAGGGLPGYGSLSPTPGLAPGAAPGDMDDLTFLRQSLQEVKALGGQDVLDRTWLSVHNYGQAHLRVRDYDRIVREEVGRSLPQIGTEAGIYPNDTFSQEQATQVVADAYRYLPQREDYYFAYTYWIIANESGQGHTDNAWNHQALFRPDGQSPLVDILKSA